MNRGSRAASGTTHRRPSSCRTAAHIESSRRQIDASNPNVAIWCCSMSVMMLIVAIGTSQIRAASSTTATSSARGDVVERAVGLDPRDASLVVRGRHALRLGPNAPPASGTSGLLLALAFGDRLGDRLLGEDLARGGRGLDRLGSVDRRQLAARGAPLSRASSASTSACELIASSSRVMSSPRLSAVASSRAPEAISSSIAPARACICAVLSSARWIAAPTSPISSPRPETASLIRVCASAAV